MSGKSLPPPDDSGTDANSVLRSRFSMAPPPPAAPVVEPATPIPAHTQGTSRPYTGKDKYGQKPSVPKLPGKNRLRDDPPGMKRLSLYVALDAADELDEAANRAVENLGDVPKHVILSALLRKAAAAADQVVSELAEARAAELTEQLSRLRRPSE